MIVYLPPVTVNCPNCGKETVLLELRQKCGHCGTVVSIVEVKFDFTVQAYVNDEAPCLPAQSARKEKGNQ